MTWDSAKKTPNTLNDPLDSALGTSLDDFDEEKLSTQALSYKLAQFDRAVIGVPVTRGAVAQPLPAPLRRALIFQTQISGNDQLIPKVNQVTLPTSVEGGARTFAGFSTIESVPTDATHIPLLAQWISKNHPEENGLIPSISLLTLMSAHGTDPSEIHVQCGEYIRLGKTGPIIPIDDYGQTPTPKTTDSTTTISKIPAEQLITNTQFKLDAPLCLLHANGKTTTHTNLIGSEELSNIITLSKTLPTLGSPTILQKLSFGFEFLLILGISFVATIFITFKQKNRHFAFALTIPAIIILLLIMMTWKQQWFGITVPILTLISAWILSSQLKTSPLQKSHF